MPAPKNWNPVWFFLLGLSAGFVPQRCAAVDAVVVRPAAWKVALEPWRQHRAAQGIDVLELDAELGREEIRSSISRLKAEHPDTLRFVLLAADVSRPESPGIPTFYRDSTAMVQFGGDARIATDNPYADVDGDELPDLAIGRIPADSAPQLSRILARVIGYETSSDFSTWRRDVHVVAGVGGFGAVADSVIEMTTRRFLADRIPGWSNLSMTQASLRSHYCPDPWRFSETCIDRLNQGGMFWVYIGHGHVKTLDYVKVNEDYLPILLSQQVPAIQTQDHPPIAVFLACYTGAFDAREDALAEEMILSGQGPIAAIAASRVSGPYGLAMLSDGLLANFYEDQQSTLGEIVLSSKRHLLAETGSELAATPSASSPTQMIGAIASALSPEGYDLRAERMEHVWQMHLLGDPMLRISHPEAMRLQVPEQVAPGDVLAIQGTSLTAGEMKIEFAFRREQVRRELDQLVGDLGTRAGRDTYQKRYQAANDRILATIQRTVSPGPFEVEVSIPADLPRGKYCIRSFVESPQSWQVGYAEIRVRPAPPTPQKAPSSPQQLDALP